MTGCSSGIGRATAERLAAGGYTVYATARRPESIADLEAAGCKTLALDVNSEESMRAAVRDRRGRRGRDRRARQQRRHPGDRRDRDAADGPRARHLRDQPVRAGAARPARAAGHAQGGRRPDRHRRLDERQVHLARHRLLLRDQARAGGHQRLPALRGRARSASTSCCSSPGSSRPRWARPRSAAARRTPTTRTATTTPQVAEAATNYTTGMLGMLACTPEAVAKVVQKSLDAEQAEGPLPDRALGAHVHGHAQGDAGRRVRRLPALADTRRLNVLREERRDLVLAF